MSTCKNGASPCHSVLSQERSKELFNRDLPCPRWAGGDGSLNLEWMLPIVDCFRNIIFVAVEIGESLRMAQGRSGYNQLNMPHSDSAAGLGRVSDDQLPHLRELVCDYQFPR